MLSKLQYVVVERDVAAGTTSKIAKLINPILNKETILTGGMFDIRSKEDFDTIIKIYTHRKGYKFPNIKGVQIPLHNLPLYAAPIRRVLPKENMIISDVESEFFFYDGLKRGKADFYKKNNLLPDEMKRFMEAVQGIDDHATKLKAHKAAWRAIIADKNMLNKFITNTINFQSKFGVEFICAPTPLILDTEHLELVEECYDKAKALYHGEALELEDSGKIVALYLNIHKGFLSQRVNVSDLLTTIRRLNPKAIVIKIARLGDIREEDTETIQNWKFLMANVGMLTSDEIPIPTVYLSAGVDGLIAQAFSGIDIFTQSFNKSDNIEKEFITSAAGIKKMWDDNPKLTSGKIAIYDSKEFEPRISFEKLLDSNGGSPYPMPELEDLDPATVRAVSPKTFREFAKLILMMLRDFEIQETINAIKNGEVRALKSKFRKWVGTHSILP